jgi:hypothetical protein
MHMVGTEVMHFRLFAFLLLACAWLPGAPAQSARIDIGGGFSVEAPASPGWQPTGGPGSWLKRLAPEGHSLAFVVATGPSGITQQDLMQIRGPEGGARLAKLVSGYYGRAWAAHAAGMNQSRFTKIDVANDSGKEAALGELLCAKSRIRVRDRGGMPEGATRQLRYVAYSCIQFPDMTTAAYVSYSERGRDEDLSDEAMAEGERLAQSLRRAP